MIYREKLPPSLSSKNLYFLFICAEMEMEKPEQMASWDRGEIHWVFFCPFEAPLKILSEIKRFIHHIESAIVLVNIENIEMLKKI